MALLELGNNKDRRPPLALHALPTETAKHTALDLLHRYKKDINDALDIKHSMQRIRLMGLEDLSIHEVLDRKLRFIPYHALRDEALLQSVAESVTKKVLELLEEKEHALPQDVQHALREHLHASIIAKIHANYPLIANNLDIFAAFYPPNGRIVRAFTIDEPPSLTLAQTLQMAKEITWHHAQTLLDSLSDDEYNLFHEIIDALGEGRLLSQQEVYQSIEAHTGEHEELVDSFKDKFSLFAKAANMELLQQSQAYPKDYPKNKVFNEWITSVEKSVDELENIPKTFTKYQIELGLKQKPIDFVVDSELRTALPIDLLATILESKDDHWKAFVAQHILIKSFERLILENHPIQDAIIDLHSRMDFSSVFVKIPPENPDAVSYIVWDNQLDCYIMVDEKPEIELFSGHEDTSLAESDTLSQSEALHKKLLYTIDWRYAMINGKNVYYNGKPIRAHVVGRGRKTEKATLIKIDEKGSLELVPDEQRSRVIYPFTDEEILHGVDEETGESLLSILTRLNVHIGKRTLRLKPALEKTSKYALDLGEFTIVNQLNGNEKNIASTDLWKDLRINAVSPLAATAEVQNVSFITYMDFLNPEDVRSYGSYARPRDVKSTLQAVPSSLRPDMHENGNAILERHKQVRDEQTEHAKKMQHDPADRWRKRLSEEESAT